MKEREKIADGVYFKKRRVLGFIRCSTNEKVNNPKQTSFLKIISANCMYKINSIWRL